MRACVYVCLRNVNCFVEYVVTLGYYISFLSFSVSLLFPSKVTDHPEEIHRELPPPLRDYLAYPHIFARDQEANESLQKVESDVTTCIVSEILPMLTSADSVQKLLKTRSKELADCHAIV